MGGAWRWLASHAGRRGGFLAFLAVLDFAYGYSLLVTPAQQRQHLDLLLPWQAWGIIWLAVGVLCAARVLALRDRIAYTAAATLKAVWAALFADVWLTTHYQLGWVAVIVWAAFAATVMLVASWPEPLAKPAVVP